MTKKTDKNTSPLALQTSATLERHQRIGQMRDLHEFLLREMPVLIERWQQEYSQKH